MPAAVDHTGKVYGRLTALKVVRPNGVRKWKCLCRCGKTTVVMGASLSSGDTKSCGCLHKDIVTGPQESMRSKHPSYYANPRMANAWRSMHDRCYNPKNKYYARYGGRGIKVCKRWFKFELFLADMGKRPKGMQLDRINNDKGYSKSNCHWVTSKANNRNRANNVILTYKGKSQTLSEWAEELNVNYTTLHERHRKGWSARRVLDTRGYL